jgi:dihydrofolate reductase
MRRLILNTFVSLDGVMQAPGGPEEDPTGGFDHGGWAVTQWDDLMWAAIGETMGKPFDLVLGRKTYEIFAAHWPHTDEEPAEQLNNATKHVASTTLEGPLDWANSHLIEGDVPTGVSRLKEQDGPELQVHGSADLIQTLLENDLIDEFRLYIYPLVLGKGKRLFGEGTIPANLKLTDSKVSSTGVMVNTYEPAGEVPIGTFEFEEPTEAEVERRARLTNS